MLAEKEKKKEGCEDLQVFSIASVCGVNFCGGDSFLWRYLRAARGLP